MPTPPTAIELQILSAARESRRALVNDLSRAMVPGEAVAVVCDRVTGAVDRYSGALLDDLLAAVHPLSPADTAWVRDRYLELMLELATSACDVARESGARHAVAQAVQCTILQHEQRLRTVLESALAGDR